MPKKGLWCTGDLNINRSITVYMEAGYDCIHFAQTSTTIVGNMTVSGGKVIIQSGTLVVQ